MTDEALTGLGMPVPDSALARRARALIADVAAPFLVNHSIRSYAWAVELARHDEVQFDPEILYVSAVPTTSGSGPHMTSAAASRSMGRSPRNSSCGTPANPTIVPARSTT